MYNFHSSVVMGFASYIYILHVKSGNNCEQYELDVSFLRHKQNRIIIATIVTLVIHIRITAYGIGIEMQTNKCKYNLTLCRCCFCY